MPYKVYCLRYNSTESNLKYFSQAFPEKAWNMKVMFQEFTAFIFIIYFSSPKGPMDHLAHYIFSSKLKSAFSLPKHSKFSCSTKMSLNQFVSVALRADNCKQKAEVRSELPNEFDLTKRRGGKKENKWWKFFTALKLLWTKKKKVWQAHSVPFHVCK